MLTVGEPPPLAEMTACRRCCHPIVGGPPFGRCPECGAEYDRGGMVLFGRHRRTIRQRWGWAAVAAVALAMQLADLLLIGRRSLHMAGLVLLTSIFAGGVLAAVERRWAGRRHAARVSLSRAGCGIEIEPSPSALHMRVLALLPFPRDRRSTDERSWQAERALRWSTVRQLWITRAGDDHWRLRFVHRRARWRRTPIDVIVTAPPEQLAALRTFAARFTNVSSQ